MVGAPAGRGAPHRPRQRSTGPSGTLDLPAAVQERVGGTLAPSVAYEVTKLDSADEQAASSPTASWPRG